MYTYIIIIIFIITTSAGGTQRQGEGCRRDAAERGAH